VGEQAMAGAEVSPNDLLELVLHAYGLHQAEVAPLLEWCAP